MTKIAPLSLAAWIGGGALGAALSKEHRIAGAGLGAFLVGGFGDVLIERHQKHLPMAGAAISLAAIGGFALLAIASGDGRKGK